MAIKSVFTALKSVWRRFTLRFSSLDQSTTPFNFSVGVEQEVQQEVHVLTAEAQRFPHAVIF